MNPGTLKRAACYARTATGQEQGNFALASQIEQYKTYCQEHKYIVEEKHIYSEVYGGRSDYHNRPQLTALIEAAKQQEFDIVIIYAFDRLSRDQVQITAIIDHLKQYGVTVESVTEHDQPNIAMLVKAANEQIAQMQRYMQAKRIQHGKAMKKAQREQQQ
jgi:site-specific DNA recombinase